MPEIMEDLGKRIRHRSILFPFSYHKLPSHQVCNLSVRKLDGSSFDVQTLQTATVADLKRSVEQVFAQSPTTDYAPISWSHVWSHFCLCFDGQKLVDDKDYIQSFGIQDGSQLHFIHHLSINHDLMDRSLFKQPKILCAWLGLLKNTRS